MNPLLIALVGPSGVGKTTLQGRLEKDLYAAEFSVSDTTRSLREGEIEGLDYNIVSLERFKANIHEGKYLEWARVHDFYYGTPKEPAVYAQEEGRDFLLVIDVEGAAQIRKAVSEDPLLRGKYVDFFIMPPAPELESLRKRLESRNEDSPEVINKRLQNAAREMSRRGEFYKVLVNDDLERVYSELGAGIERFRGTIKG